MREKQSFSPKEDENQTNKEPKVAKKEEVKDPCPACGGELYLDHEYTSRIGLLGENDDVIGWKCPTCSSEFDLDGNFSQFFDYPGMIGKA